MPYLSSEELVLPRKDLTGNPTSDNFFHTLPSQSGPRSIQGFLGDDYQKHVFYQIGWWCRGTGVELGSFYGLSTVLFGLGMKDSPWQQGKIIAIDWWGDDPYLGNPDLWGTFSRNIETFGVKQYIQPVRGSCEDPNVIPFTPLEFLYMDASHCIAELRVNWKIFAPMLKPGSLAIWHDTHHAEVREHIEECRQQDKIEPVITNRPDFQIWRTSK